MLVTPYCELIDDRVWNLIHNSFPQPQLSPPYLNAITSLIGSPPNGFGEICCQAAEVLVMRIANHNVCRLQIISMRFRHQKCHGYESKLWHFGVVNHRVTVAKGVGKTALRCNSFARRVDIGKNKWREAFDFKELLLSLLVCNESDILW